MQRNKKSRVKTNQESFLYRVFSTNSIHDLEHQQFTYLGAEIVFTKHGKEYIYPEDSINFQQFHDFLSDKYDNYLLEDFILVTKQGQFNLRYFPITKFEPDEDHDLIDDINVHSFRMFQDLLPLGTDLLLSILDDHHLQDFPNSQKILERLIKLIDGDKDPFLRVQIQMNLIELQFNSGEYETCRNILNHLYPIFGSGIHENLRYCRSIRHNVRNDELMGRNLFIYDYGAFYRWYGLVNYILENNPSNYVSMLKRAINFWTDIDFSNDEDLFSTYVNLIQVDDYDYFGNDKPTIHKMIEIGQRVSNKSFSHRIQLGILYGSIGDFYNSIEIIRDINPVLITPRQLFSRNLRLVNFYLPVDLIESKKLLQDIEPYFINSEENQITGLDRNSFVIYSGITYYLKREPRLISRLLKIINNNPVKLKDHQNITSYLKYLQNLFTEPTHSLLDLLSEIPELLEKTGDFLLNSILWCTIQEIFIHYYDNLDSSEIRDQIHYLSNFVNSINYQEQIPIFHLLENSNGIIRREDNLDISEFLQKNNIESINLFNIDQRELIIEYFRYKQSILLAVNSF